MRLRETLVGGRGRKHIPEGWAPPPPGGPSRRPGTAALSSRMPSHASKKTVDPQAREISLPVGQRREGQGELGPFDDHLCHSSVSPAPPDPSSSLQQSQWLWREPKDSPSSPHHERLGRRRQKLLRFPEVSHFTRG